MLEHRVDVLGHLVRDLGVRRWIERRSVVLGAAAAGFAAVFAVRQAVSGEVETVGLAYVVPISLVALELGAAAGTLDAAFAFLLVAVGSLG
jgi:hypothetical protein